MEIKYQVNVDVKISNNSNVLLQLAEGLSDKHMLISCVGWLLRVKTTLKAWVARRRMLEQVAEDNESDPHKRAAGVDNQMRQWKMTAMGDSTTKLKSTYLSPEGLAEAEILLCTNDQACYLEQDLSMLSKALPEFIVPLRSSVGKWSH